jgi:transcriptional regulator with XRE-family HTH domain
MIKRKLVAALKGNDRFFHKNGSINVSAIARESGVPQPTVKRILDGSVKSPGVENIQRICDATGIDIAVIYGDKIPAEIPQSLSTQEKQLLAIFNSLSSKSKKLAIKIIALLE